MNKTVSNKKLICMNVYAMKMYSFTITKVFIINVVQTPVF